MFSLVRKFISHVLPGILKPLRVLWNEIIGFLFLSIAVIFGLSTYRRLASLKDDLEGLIVVILAGAFVLLMLGFGISSFLRARKISRS